MASAPEHGVAATAELGELGRFQLAHRRGHGLAGVVVHVTALAAPHAGHRPLAASDLDRAFEHAHARPFGLADHGERGARYQDLSFRRREREPRPEESRAGRDAQDAAPHLALDLATEPAA